MLPENIVAKIRDEIDHCTNPLFFFHDDPDGTTSYVQMCRYKQEGKGHMIKMVPRMKEEHTRWVHEFGPDKVFIFDVAMMDQAFADNCPVPIVWLDHHDVVDIDGVKYYNAKNYGETTPPSVMCYQVCEKDLWLACVGAIGDWYWTDLLYDLQKAYPSLLGITLDSVKGRPEEVMFNTQLGTLVNVVSYNLKGTSKDALAAIEQLKMVDDPMEILEQSSEAGAYLWKRYLDVRRGYEEERERAISSDVAEDPLFVHQYVTTKYSVTKDLANELSYRFKDKVIVLARARQGAHVMSLRSGRDGPELNEALERALSQFENCHGGGHAHACGASVRSEDFADFLRVLREELGL